VLPSAQATGRLQVGDNVTLRRSRRSGRIVDDDGDGDIPFEVELEDGEKYWYREDEVEPASLMLPPPSSQTLNPFATGIVTYRSLPAQPPPTLLPPPSMTSQSPFKTSTLSPIMTGQIFTMPPNTLPPTTLPQQDTATAAEAPEAAENNLPKETEFEVDEEEELEGNAEGFGTLEVKKPRTKWRTAKDYKGPMPGRRPPTAGSDAALQDTIYPGYHHTQGHPRMVETNERYWNNLNEEHSSAYPFWIGAGTPAARVEPTWQDGNWYLVAPVDYKGLESFKAQGKWSSTMEHHALTGVDDAVMELDEQGHLAPLPPPRHWKEHKSCPIA
jgi:hypothetical protein